MADQPAEPVDDDVPEDVDVRVGPEHLWTPRVLVERLKIWSVFIGPGRFAGAAGALLVIAGVGWWLLRTPPLPTEAALPIASHPATAPTSSSIPPGLSTATAPSDAPGSVVVHVTGAVNQPGVYELAAGQRVDDALAAAGGASSDADPNALNLAAPLIDGDRIEVPIVGQSGSIATSDAGVTHAAVDGDASAGVGEPVDLNEATAAELEALPGIGPATAAAIVEYRTQVGPFGSIDQLLDVPGIGPAKLEAIREDVTA